MIDVRSFWSTAASLDAGINCTPSPRRARRRPVSASRRRRFLCNGGNNKTNSRWRFSQFSRLKENNRSDSQGKMPAKKMRRELEEMGVNTSGMFEYDELEAAYKRAQQTEGNSHRSSSSREETEAPRVNVSDLQSKLFSQIGKLVEKIQSQSQIMAASAKNRFGNSFDDISFKSWERVRLVFDNAKSKVLEWEERNDVKGRAREKLQGLRTKLISIDSNLGVSQFLKVNGPTYTRKLQEFQDTRAGQILSTVFYLWLIFSGAFWILLTVGLPLWYLATIMFPEASRNVIASVLGVEPAQFPGSREDNRDFFGRSGTGRGKSRKSYRDDDGDIIDINIKK